MMSFGSHDRALRRILWELRAYLSEIIVIGGWVPWLYRRYGGFASWSTGLSFTSEVDVLVDRPLEPGERPTIPTLLREAGFRPDEGPGGTAVWSRGEEPEEKIEFLVPHTGTARTQGVAVPVDMQVGMGAIALPGLEFLRHFSGSLTIPLVTGTAEIPLQVRVPLLGAYLVNKASTFARRQAHEGGGNPKRTKDLLYLRDLIAAGREVVERIEADLAAMASDRRLGRLVRGQVRDARNNLGVHELLARELPAVARMLVERDRSLSDPAALADVQGSLADLRELLRPFES